MSLTANPIKFRLIRNHFAALLLKAVSQNKLQYTLKHLPKPKRLYSIVYYGIQYYIYYYITYILE